MTADTTAGGSGGSSPLASTGRPTLTRLGSVKLRAAFTISSTGDWIYKFAVPTLILHLTGSALDTAFAYVLEFIPYVVVGPFAGVLADRLSRRGTMIVCDYSSCALALIIAGLVQLGHPAIALLYLCALALSCTRPIYFPAFQGFLVEMVRPDDRPRFNSWTEITDSLLSLAGPVLGVSIVAAAGVPLATVLDAVSFAVSATLVATIAYRRLVAPEAPARRWITGVLSDLGAGLRIVGMSRAILAGTVLLTASNLAAYVIEGNLVYVVLNVEHHAKIALGVVFALQGAGGVVGAFGAPRLLPGRPAGRLIVVGLATCAIGMIFQAVMPQLPTIMAGQFFEGAGSALIVVCWFSSVQRLIPPNLIGRFVSVVRAIGYATLPVGALLGAWLLGLSRDSRTLFVTAAAIELAILIVASRSALIRIGEEASLEAGRSLEEPGVIA